MAPGSPVASIVSKSLPSAVVDRYDRRFSVGRTVPAAAASLPSCTSAGAVHTLAPARLLPRLRLVDRPAHLPAPVLVHLGPASGLPRVFRHGSSLEVIVGCEVEHRVLPNRISVDAEPQVTVVGRLGA